MGYCGKRKIQTTQLESCLQLLGCELIVAVLVNGIKPLQNKQTQANYCATAGQLYNNGNCDMAQAFFPVLYNAIGQLGTTSVSGADSSCQDLPLVPAACTPGAAEQELAVAVQPLLKQPGRSGLERKSYQGLLNMPTAPNLPGVSLCFYTSTEIFQKRYYDV
jgi:hypothetical protein